MAIDSINKVSNEQLLAMNMISNGQLTNESSSTGSTSDESNLAFQLVMQNLLESSKNDNKKNAATVSESVNSGNSETTNAEKLSNTKNTKNTNVDNGNVVANSTARAAQQYATGQNLKDIPKVLNNRYVNRSGESRSILSNRSDADMQKIYNAVNTASKKYGVDSNLILAIIKQESDFDSNSTSGSGASGLMQVMPGNFANLGIADQYDVDQNINGGTKLFKEYLDQFNGNKELALMAYNGGPGTVKKRGVSSAADLYKMPKETQNYVPKVMGYYRNGV